MSGLFSTFNTIRRAISAQQGAINTTSHNIANANTEGYSRQRVTMQTTAPAGMPALNSSSGPGQIGTGVDITEITRARDLFLDMQIRYEKGTLGKFSARDEFLSEVETIFLEPSDNGLSTTMGKMWDAWQELAKNPENSNARVGVVEASLTLTDQINHTYKQLQDLQNHGDELIKGQVFDFNNIISQIENLNKQIQGVRITGNNPNDLMDKQDLLIDKLSAMLNIKVERGSLGEAVIKTGNTAITGNAKSGLSFIKSFERNADNTGYIMTYYNNGDTNDEKRVELTDAEYEGLKDSKLLWTDNQGNFKGAVIENGSIQGYVSIYDEINEYKEQLNALARGIAIAVNTVHNDGKLPGQDGYIAFFTAVGNEADESKITAENITVNSAIQKDSSLIKAGESGSSAVGDGKRALAIAQIRDARIYMNEFLYSKSTIISGVVSTRSTGGTLVIKANGTSASIEIGASDSLRDIADKINAVDNGKTNDSDKLFIRAVVDNGRLIIQSMKSYNNSIDVTDNNGGVLLSDLKLYSKSNSDYWEHLRTNNSIVNGYDPANNKISSDPKGTTIDSFFNDTISKLGSSANQAKSMVSGQEALIGQLEVRKDSISGVSIDEEMANLVQYQHAYQAAAKMVTVIDELLDTVINGFRR